MPLDAYKAFMPAFDDEFDDLAEIGTRPVTHLVDGAAQLTPRVELLPASGHTAGRPDGARRRRRRAASPATSASSASRRSRSRAIPATWADMLDVVVELADMIVPGHGPVGGEAEVRELQAYLRACVAAQRRRRRDPAPGPWDAWPDRDRDAINVERAALLAQGDDALPPVDAARRDRTQA